MIKSRFKSSWVRLLVLFGILVSFAVLAVVVVSLKVFEHDFIKSTNDELRHISSGILKTLEIQRNNIKGIAKIVSTRPDVQKSLEESNEEELRNFAQDFSKSLGIFGVTFCDKNGIAIASANDSIVNGETILKGEPLASLLSVQSALLGESAMFYEQIGDSAFAEIFAEPILDSNGKIAGAVIFTYDLTQAEFMDVLCGFGTDGTVFCENRRIASSISDAKGTFLKNQTIEDEVLKNGNVFVGRVKVDKMDFFSVYTPLKNDDGTIAGMIFVARKIQIVRQIYHGILRVIVPTCILVAVALIIALTRLAIHDGRVLRAKVHQLGRQVNWDVLTGANSRQFGMTELAHCFENFSGGVQSPAIMLLDVDNFKSVNDTYGHEAGDEVLKKIVKAVYENSRASDKLIRWGGDEFVGIFEGMKREICEAYSEKLLKSISSIEYDFGKGNAHVTVSVGFAYFSKEDNGYEDVLSRADEALYRSKANGKNSGCIA